MRVADSAEYFEGGKTVGFRLGDGHFSALGKKALGISVVEASMLLGVDIEAPCGESQGCGKCKIRIEEGEFEKFGVESRASHAGVWQDSESAGIGAEERRAGYRASPRCRAICWFSCRKPPVPESRW